MDLKNRKFTDLSNGQTIEIKDSFENIAISKEGNKINVNKLMDNKYYEEYIDPKDFFKNESLLSSFADKIRNIPNTNNGENYHQHHSSSNNMSNDIINNIENNVNMNNIPGSSTLYPTTNESAVIPYDPEYEKMQLLEKAKSMYGSATIDSNMQSQYDSFKRVLDDDSNIPVVEPHKPHNPSIINNINQDIKVEEPPIQRIEAKRNDIQDNDVEYNGENKVVGKNNVSDNDPILLMFQNVKRNTKFDINICISEKIPKSDFIKLMEESYNKSIIDYLAQEFTDNIINNPDILKQSIVDKINEIVYPKVNKPVTKKTPIKKSVTNKPVTKKVVTKKEDNSVKNESNKND